MKENMIITIDTGARYLLLHKLENLDGKDYFFAVGITDEDSLYDKEAIFFEVTNENGQELIEKIDPKSDLYKSLISIEYASSRMEEDPEFAQEFMQELEKFVNNNEAQ